MLVVSRLCPSFRATAQGEKKGVLTYKTGGDASCDDSLYGRGHGVVLCFCCLDNPRGCHFIEQVAVGRGGQKEGGRGNAAWLSL